MLSHFSRARLVGFWFVVVALAGVAVAAVEPGLLRHNMLLIATACVTPPAIFWLVWRGTPPPTAAELLYVVRNARDDRP